MTPGGREPGRGEPGPLPVSSSADRIHVGEHFSVSLQRTLRVPDDGREYPLPPGLGNLPLRSAADLLGAPPPWRGAGEYVVPVHQREAVWLNFSAPWWRPLAVQVGVGGVDAVSGGPWDDELHADPQNYVVCPDQPWLDGVNSGVGTVRQFVAVSLGAGDTVEEQLTGDAQVGGMQLRVFEPRAGLFPDAPPAGEAYGLESVLPQDIGPAPAGMGIAPGGVMRQRIYPDPYGRHTWDQGIFGTVRVHLVNTQQYAALTGSPPPPSPISAATYAEYGLPWFSLYDEQRGDVAPSVRLGHTQGLAERDARRGSPPDEANRSVDIDADNVIELPNEPD